MAASDLPQLQLGPPPGPNGFEIAACIAIVVIVVGLVVMGFR